ncbi:MAG TPA: helix-hairpin-helix domain-containing protein [Candidatus Paceibacterota bacterium]|nr:helix-hairpin-helix domain-containing protein [Candidatus Paceibacterota bacterium]
MANKVDLNTADVNGITQARMPQISRKRAEEIVDYRNRNGPFKNWEDVKKIPGFSDEMINNLKEGATIGGQE